MLVFNSYILNKLFGIKQEELNQISAGIPQGGVLGPILHLLCTNDIPDLEEDYELLFYRLQQATKNKQKAQ